MQFSRSTHFICIFQTSWNRIYYAFNVVVDCSCPPLSPPALSLSLQMHSLTRRRHYYLPFAFPSLRWSLFLSLSPPLSCLTFRYCLCDKRREASATHPDPDSDAWQAQAATLSRRFVVCSLHANMQCVGEGVGEGSRGETENGAQTSQISREAGSSSQAVQSHCTKVRGQL